MDSFIERFCAKYYFPYAEGRQLIEGMEYKTYRKGDCLVREGERDTSFYIIARGIWRGHYLRDGQEVSGVSRNLVGIIFYTRKVLLTSHYEKRLFEYASQPRVAGSDIRLLSYLWS